MFVQVKFTWNCSVFIILFCLSWSSSFSTDDDNDTEVEAVDLDTELNLVTECWVEPQCGTVNCADQHRYFQSLKYQEIPQAVRKAGLYKLLLKLELSLCPYVAFLIKSNRVGLRVPVVLQIFPRDLACMSTMMTFEYLSQLCQNKDQVCSLPAGLKDTQGNKLGF